MSESRANALARLDAFVGEWVMEVRFPGYQPPATATGVAPVARSRFEWILDRQYLQQRSEVPIPEAPDSLTIISVDPQIGGYVQHYYDSRGVTRLYAMSLTGGVWTLTRDSPDFSPLDFRQRFTATFSQNGNTITGAWEKDVDGTGWTHDFDLTYRRPG